MSDSKPLDDDEAAVEAIHAEVEKDMAAGDGAKHFEDLLDDVYSNPSQQHDTEAAELTSGERDKQERAFAELSRAFKARLRMMLNTGDSHGMLVTNVRRNVGGRGFLVYAKDRVGRQFEAAVDFETMGVEMALDPQRAFAKACDLLARELLAAQRKYHERAGLQ